VCGDHRVEPELVPPFTFVAVTMKLPVVSPAQRDRELVTDSSAERAVLRKAQVMGIARLTTADEAGLLGDKRGRGHERAAAQDGSGRICRPRALAPGTFGDGYAKNDALIDFRRPLLAYWA
jgi:hypothetical protein